MFGRFFVAAFCCALLANCATMPIQHVDGVSLAAVEERVKCEIGTAYRDLSGRRDQFGKPLFPDLSRWAAGLTLSLAVDSTGSVTPSTSLTGPFGSLSPLEASAGLSLNAKRTALLNVYAAFAEAAFHRCPDAPSGALLEGHLGLAQWIERVFEDQRIVEQTAIENGTKGQSAPFNSKDKSIGYTLEFVIAANAGVTPNFILTNGTAKSALAYESKSTHSLDIAMLEMDESDYKKIFKTVYVREKRESRVDKKGIMTTLTIPAHKEQRLIGNTGIGLLTKDRLDSVLKQLNEKALIQGLRR